MREGGLVKMGWIEAVLRWAKGQKGAKSSDLDLSAFYRFFYPRASLNLFLMQASLLNIGYPSGQPGSNVQRPGE